MEGWAIPTKTRSREIVSKNRFHIALARLARGGWRRLSGSSMTIRPSRVLVQQGTIHALRILASHRQIVDGESRRDYLKVCRIRIELSNKVTFGYSARIIIWKSHPWPFHVFSSRLSLSVFLILHNREIGHWLVFSLPFSLSLSLSFRLVAFLLSFCLHRLWMKLFDPGLSNICLCISLPWPIWFFAHRGMKDRLCELKTH